MEVRSAFGMNQLLNKMDTVIINIAEDFSAAIGPRLIEDGPFSAELFFEEVVKEKYAEAIAENVALVFDFRECAGFAISSWSYLCGRLKAFCQNLTNSIEFIGLDDPLEDELYDTTEYWDSLTWISAETPPIDNNNWMIVRTKKETLTNGYLYDTAGTWQSERDSRDDIIDWQPFPQ